MAIRFIHKRKKQTYLIIALAIIVLAIAAIFAQKLKPVSFSSVIPEPVVSGYPEIEINFEILEKSELKELVLFKKILPFEEEAGRENPFLPY